MKISIIVPIYNSEKYLREALTSLLEQTLSDIEIICVNDGSTDSSLSILEDFAKKDSRIVIISQENKGQSVARNEGLKVAKGEYIGFLDSDDWVAKDAFEKLYLNSSGADIVIGNICVAQNGEENHHDSYLSLDNFSQKFDNICFSHKDCSDFLFRISVTPWNKIYRREFLSSNGINFPIGINFEDNVFFLESFLRANNVRIKRDAVFYYRVDSLTSYSHQGQDAKKLDFFEIMRLQKQIIKDFREYKSAFSFHKRATLFYWYRKITERKIKVLYFLKLLKEYPLIFLSPILHPIKLYLCKKAIPKNTYILYDKYSFSVVNLLKLKQPFVTYVDVANDLGEIDICEMKDIPNNALVVVFTSSYYKYGEKIEEELRIRGFNNKVLEIVLPQY